MFIPNGTDDCCTLAKRRQAVAALRKGLPVKNQAVIERSLSLSICTPEGLFHVLPSYAIVHRVKRTRIATGKIEQVDECGD